MRRRGSEEARELSTTRKTRKKQKTTYRVLRSTVVLDAIHLTATHQDDALCAVSHEIV